MNLNVLIISILSLFSTPPDYSESDYMVKFDLIDNKVEILVNDSLVFTSGTINHNPSLDGKYTFYLKPHLTKKEDEVIIRLYNGLEPYEVEQDDKHWEIEYVIKRGNIDYDYMWDAGDNNKTGLVFEERYYL